MVNIQAKGWALASWEIKRNHSQPRHKLARIPDTMVSELCQAAGDLIQQFLPPEMVQDAVRGSPKVGLLIYIYIYGIGHMASIAIASCAMCCNIPC